MTERTRADGKRKLIVPLNAPIQIGEWPDSSNGKNYAKIFKDMVPDAYSWQFDDFNSTYQCKAPDYIIRFY